MKKKTILISAANSKLGFIICQYLLERGYIVYAGIHKTSDKIKSLHKINLIEFDVTNKLICKKAFDKIISKEGHIDVVINVAGATIAKQVTESSEDELMQLFKINCASQLNINSLAFDFMKKQSDGGSIINIISLSGLVSLPNFGIYSASKFAASALGQAAHYEFAKYKIKVVNIFPGAIDFGSLSSANIVGHKTFRDKFPILKYLLKMTTPEGVSQRIDSLIESHKNPISVILGRDAFLVYIANKYSPESIWNKLVLYYWQKE